MYGFINHVMGSYCLFLAMTKYYLIEGHEGRYLTERQFECAKTLVDDYTAKQIAKIMGISPRTVEDYIGILKNKFSVKRQSELISKLVKANLISKDK